MTGDKFMLELHLKQAVCIYSACGPFTKHRERIEKFSQIGKLKKLWKNEFKKNLVCSWHSIFW